MKLLWIAEYDLIVLNDYVKKSVKDQHPKLLHFCIDNHTVSMN